VKDYLPHFNRVARRLRPSLQPLQLELEAGSWLGSSAVKVQKRTWTSAPGMTEAGESGIFFSVWITEASRNEQRTLYNIHALKLRGLPGYSLQSREFAEAFRRRFSPQLNSWPNASVKFGPQTLMQGWITLEPDRLEADVEKLIRRFVPLARTIDELLAGRKSG